MRRILDRMTRRARKPQAKVYAMTHPMALTVGVASAVVALASVLVPSIESKALMEYLPDTLSIAWTWLLFTGGVLTTYGIIYFKPQWEAAGLTLLAYMFTALGIAISDYNDPPVAVTMLVVVSLGVACLARVLVLLAWASREAERNG